MVVAERILLARRSRARRLVDRRRRAVQERLRPPAVRHQASRALGIGRQIAIEVGGAALDHREVQHGVEVVPERVEGPEGEIHGDRLDAGLLEPLAVAALGEPRQAGHLVLPRQRLGHGKAHLPGGAGHQQPSALQRHLCGGHLGTGF